MSYILDALRRAERERRADGSSPLEQVATAAPVPIPTVPQRRSLRRWALPAAVVLLLAVGVFWWFRQPKPPMPRLLPATERAQTGNSASQGVDSRTIAAAAKPAKPVPPPPRPAVSPVPAVIEAPNRIAKLGDLMPAPLPNPSKPATAAPGAAAEQASPPPNVAPGAAVQPTVSQHPQNTTNPITSAPGATTVISNSTLPPGAASMAPMPTTPATQQSTQSTQTLRQMPEDYRSHFPSFTVEVHVYDPDPSKRWVMIDGHHYQEGQTLPTGPKIYRIVPQGIVFDWQGKRVLYALDQ